MKTRFNSYDVVCMTAELQKYFFSFIQFIRSCQSNILLSQIFIPLQSFLQVSWFTCESNL